MRRNLITVSLFTFIIISNIFHIAHAATDGVRNPKWAIPIELSGVPNLHRVDENIYRSAQPTAEGMRNLEKLGIRTILNLRSNNSDREEISGTTMREVRIKMHAWSPELESVIKTVQVLSDDTGAPYLIHCQHGADRTGMIVAIYRMAIQDWDRESAIDEMLDGGYGFHTIWKDIVKFLKDIDIQRVKTALI